MLNKTSIVPERKKDIINFLTEISKHINSLSSDFGAMGDFAFFVREPKEKNEKWIIETSGSISDGQDNDGNEIWKNTELTDDYSGETLKNAAEKVFSDFKIYYGKNLP